MIHMSIWYNQTCIKRSPLGQRKKRPYKTGDLLRDSTQMKFSMTGQEEDDL
jgi:hypothetical protein